MDEKEEYSESGLETAIIDKLQAFLLQIYSGSSLKIQVSNQTLNRPRSGHLYARHSQTVQSTARENTRAAPAGV